MLITYGMKSSHSILNKLKHQVVNVKLCSIFQLSDVHTIMWPWDADCMISSHTLVEELHLKIYMTKLFYKHGRGEGAPGQSAKDPCSALEGDCKSSWVGSLWHICFNCFVQLEATGHQWIDGWKQPPCCVNVYWDEVVLYTLWPL